MNEKMKIEIRAAMTISDSVHEVLQLLTEKDLELTELFENLFGIKEDLKSITEIIDSLIRKTIEYME